MEGLAIGRIVHHVSGPESSYPKGHSPAIVVDVFDKEVGYILLRNFADLCLYSCTFNENREINSWHWPEKA